VDSRRAGKPRAVLSIRFAEISERPVMDAVPALYPRMPVVRWCVQLALGLSQYSLVWVFALYTRAHRYADPGMEIWVLLLTADRMEGSVTCLAYEANAVGRGSPQVVGRWTE